MRAERPDPDRLLKKVQLEEPSRGGRGKLKVFLGAAPGVGKTYSMLEEARRLASKGIEVVVGYVEPHARPETTALLSGLETLPPREIVQGTIRLRELDLEGALARRPAVLLVDELAHTNPPGSRHPKRWQDVEELLGAGINVLTTLNIQHVESLRDLVARITGVSVRETVPDSILDQADEIRLVDLSPDELLERLRAGKVYVPREAERALESFFCKENLVALRELALRGAAERVGAQLEGYRQTHPEQPIWSTSDRLLVCVGPSPFASQLIRATRRMAQALKAPWLAVHVERSTAAPLSSTAREQLSRNLQLAGELGAETLSITGENVATAVVDLARKRNVTRIVVGKPREPRWREALFGSFVYDLTRACGEIDVYVISGDVAPGASAPPAPRPRAPRLRPVILALLATVAATAVCFPLSRHFAESNLVMVYLLGVCLVAARGDQRASALASVFGVLTFDFFFVPPHGSFAVADVQYLVTFAVMLTTGLLVSGLTGRLRLQAEAARQREAATSALYQLSRTLGAATAPAEIAREASRHLEEVLSSRVAIVLSSGPGKLEAADAGSRGFAVGERELGVAAWVVSHGKPAGLGTTTLPSMDSLWVPLRSSGGTLGALGLRPRAGEATLDPRLGSLLETFSGQVALALERTRLAEHVRATEMKVATEQLRNALLSSVSHDLRTPLASIVGSSSTLLRSEAALTPAARRDLTETILEEAERLNRLVGNLLDVTRLEAGAITLRREWESLEEIVGVALGRLARSAPGRVINTRLPETLPLVAVDAALLEQAIFNLLDNAVRHTPAETPVEISASAAPGSVEVVVSDRGPGLPPGEEQRIFERFHRAAGAQARAGTGLGLTVTRGIVQAHGGTILAENRPGGGAVFRFTLPLPEPPPAVPSEPEQAPVEPAGPLPGGP